MGNKKNHKKRKKIGHLMTCRKNAQKLNAKRWSNHNAEIDGFCTPEPPDDWMNCDTGHDGRVLESCCTEPSIESSPQFVTLTNVEPDITFVQPDNILPQSLQDVAMDVDGNNSLPNLRKTMDMTMTEEEMPFSVEPESQEDHNLMTGRRILDINYFLKRLCEISAHESMFNCNMSTLELISEKRTGLKSIFKFNCKLCGLTFSVNSDDPKNDNTVDINTAAVSGIISTGIGYSQFEEMSSAMDIPVFTEKYYAKIQDDVFENWAETAADVMEQAACRERDAAIMEFPNGPRAVRLT